MRLAVLYAAAEAVQVTLADEDVFIGLLEVEHDTMHPVDRLLESFKVRGDRDNVLVKGANLELMILKVPRNVLLVRLGIDVFLELSHIEIVPDADHSLVPANELILEFQPELIDVLLDLRFELLLVEVHIGKQVINLFLVDLV